MSHKGVTPHFFFIDIIKVDESLPVDITTGVAAAAADVESTNKLYVKITSDVRSEAIFGIFFDDTIPGIPLQGTLIALSGSPGPNFKH